ncbi:hypothetical protein AYI70_g11614 [Smittium culicis]|uniref:Uncharacterized protein n=1 Tax=Smittium culicis TaxID=133412 RepID=A0A1R1X118_9FUNG|nr:hypothetical protein AYI70_g11614 [Smittium culicis]
MKFISVSALSLLLSVSSYEVTVTKTVTACKPISSSKASVVPTSALKTSTSAAYVTPSSTAAYVSPSSTAAYVSPSSTAAYVSPSSTAAYVSPSTTAAYVSPSTTVVPTTAAPTTAAPTTAAPTTAAPTTAAPTTAAPTTAAPMTTSASQCPKPSTSENPDYVACTDAAGCKAVYVTNNQMCICDPRGGKSCVNLN